MGNRRTRWLEVLDHQASRMGGDQFADLLAEASNDMTAPNQPVAGGESLSAQILTAESVLSGQPGGSNQSADLPRIGIDSDWGDPRTALARQVALRARLFSGDTGVTAGAENAWAAVRGRDGYEGLASMFAAMGALAGAAAGDREAFVLARERAERDIQVAAESYPRDGAELLIAIAIEVDSVMCGGAAGQRRAASAGVARQRAEVRATPLLADLDDRMRQRGVRSLMSEGQRPLTAHERRLVAGVAGGLTSSELAVRLGVSPRTIEATLAGVREALGVTSTAAAIRLVALPRLQPNISTAVLTSRQSEAVSLAALGWTDRSIGEHLGISTKGAEKLLAQARLRSGMPNRSALAAWWGTQRAPATSV